MIQNLTLSDFDHVACLIRYPKTKQLVLLECSHPAGVRTFDFRNLAEDPHYWLANYSKVVYRKLNMPAKPPNFDQEVRHFLNKNIGKPY